MDDGRGYVLGYFQEFQEDQKQIAKGMVRYTKDRHLLTVAPTRAGKGVSAIIPNLLRYAGSAVVIDPKGENAMRTARQREAMGQKIFVADPWNITNRVAAHFNPMDWLDPEDVDIGENALMLADALIVGHPEAREPFWDDEARALAWGFILHVATDPAEKEQRTLPRVRDIITRSYKALNADGGILERMYQSPFQIVSRTAERLISMDDKLRSNIFTGLQSHTHFLDSPRIRESLRYSDFSFADLKTQPMTVYLVLPADRLNTFRQWFRLLVQQAITVNARNIESKPANPILFMLDEMQQLGNLTMVAQAYSLMAGFGMQMWGIVQDFGVLKATYGDRWETFVANSGVLQYFGSRDQTTAEYFSKLCGVTTVQTTSWSQTIAQAISSTTNYNTIQRPLAYPDELMVLRKNQELLLIENHNPMFATKIEYYTDPRFKDLADSLPQRSLPVT